MPWKEVEKEEEEEEEEVEPGQAGAEGSEEGARKSMLDLEVSGTLTVKSISGP